jgi:hypothetical protein
MMKHTYRTMILLLCIALAGGTLAWLAGCGGGGSNDQIISNYNPGGTSSSTSTITSITDNEGGTNYVSGQEIVIRGSGFGATRAIKVTKDGGQSTVTFKPNGTGASPVTAATYPQWSDTQITCTIPTDGVVTNKYQVQVNVVNSSGTMVIAAPEVITISSAAAANIISISPLTANQGATITIHGDGFGAEVDDAYESVQDGGYIIFGTLPMNVQPGGEPGIQQNTTSYWSRTMVICQVPATVPAKSVSINVVPYGNQNLAGHSNLNVVGPTAPTIGTISPATLDTGATTPITIAGTYFGSSKGTGKVTFQPETGTPVPVTTVTSWSDKKIILPTPSDATKGNGSVFVTVTTGSGAATNAYAFNVNSVGPLLHGPRLGLITQTNTTISWDTRDSEIGEVKWGTSTTYTGSLKETSATTHHRLMVEGLTKATTYHYAVVAGGKTMTDHTFTTAPEDGANTFSFVYMADNRGSSDQADLISISPGFDNILKQILKLKPAFSLHAGDLFYGNQYTAVVEPLYDSFKRGTDPMCGDISMLISPGNHEMQPLTDPEGNSVDPNVLFSQQFAQPNQFPGYDGTTFSFDWGNSHFVSVDTCHYDITLPNQGIAYISTPQLDWLEADLKSAQAKKVRHIFVYSHANAFREPKSTLYYLGSVNQGQCDRFVAILLKYKIDAYLCGHEHLFDDQLGQNGLVQWLNGNSGSVATGKNQFTLWKINGDSAQAQVLNEDGSTFYTRTIKSSQP